MRGKVERLDPPNGKRSSAQDGMEGPEQGLRCISGLGEAVAEFASAATTVNAERSMSVMNCLRVRPHVTRISKAADL